MRMRSKFFIQKIGNLTPPANLKSKIFNHSRILPRSGVSHYVLTGYSTNTNSRKNNYKVFEHFFVHLRLAVIFSVNSGRCVVPRPCVSEVVLDSADVEQGVHVVEPAASSRLLELNRVGGFVLGQPEPVHGVVSTEFPPQPRIVSASKRTTTQIPALVDIIKETFFGFPVMIPCESHFSHNT